MTDIGKLQFSPVKNVTRQTITRHIAIPTNGIPTQRHSDTTAFRHNAIPTQQLSDTTQFGHIARNTYGCQGSEKSIEQIAALLDKMPSVGQIRF